MTFRFRDVFYRMVPTWLRSGDGERLLYSLGLMQDVFAERFRLSYEARNPSECPDDALSYMGRDRRIRRARNESAASYSTRLIRYLDDHLTQGNPYALMDQLFAYCNAAGVVLRTVDARGNWYTRAADGTRSFSLDTGNWEWDDDPATNWSRFWVIIYPDETNGPWFKHSDDFGDAGLYGGTWGTAGYTIGTTATPDEVAAVRALVQEWKPAGTRCEWIIVAFDPDSFSPTAPEPVDGNHEYWSTYANRFTFDGVDDSIVHGNVLGLTKTDEKTISIWFATTNTVGTQALIGKRCGVPPYEGYGLYQEAAGKVRYTLTGQTVQGMTVRPDVDLNDGLIHHFLVRDDGSHTAANMQVQLDGEDVALTTLLDTLTTEAITSTCDFAVGAADAASAPFDGDAWNYALWDRVLTDSEALSVYARGPAGHLGDLSPLLWCPPSGVSYPTVTDEGSGGNDGTMTLMASDDVVPTAFAARLSTARYWAGSP